MDNVVKTRLQSVQFGEAQTYKNITILPLIAPADGTFQYRTLGEALATWDIAITEVSAAGSVPDLMVVNRANKPVLLIDGEELAGAKQNRVLNTSILIKEVSETKIPVSCTEQGRWSYASQAFAESGNVMAYKSRSRKTRSVHESLQSCGAPVSNQGEVWNGIAELQVKACCTSPTSAMSDVYKARDEDLRQCDETFKPVANQIGLLAFIGGKPAGVELVSLISAYAKLHPKLVRSYALEALIESRPSPAGAGQGGTPAPGEGKSGASAVSLEPSIPAQAHAFLAEIVAADERQFPSVGHGTDYRYKARALAGTALVHEKEVVHAAFFRLEETGQPVQLAPLRRRRQYRE
ncbi:MAG TPA: hypothetical protein P5205_04625 [Candidatus Paceibacterota bacterium]|nr:hypothetical protein [Verrucomicrobiota bacterium]HSA09636.1 hypothetical protein [Candidatus Paceibacterota bacterium]